MNVFRQISQFSEKYRILRGMASYALLWPCASLCEQTLCEGRTYKNYDWKKCAKFACFGAFAMGPAMYLWVRVAAGMWPKSDVKSSLCKAITEQVGFDPFAISLFLYTMSIMDGKTKFEAKEEVENKFLDAYKVGVIYWPCVQTVNFTFVHPRNQVVFTSIFSFIWTSFLAWVKYVEDSRFAEGHHDILTKPFDTIFHFHDH